MPLSVLERFSQLRRRVRLLVWLHGLSWIIAGSLSTLMIVSLIDWAFHVSAGMRVLFGLLLLSLTGYLLFRRLWSPLSVKLTDLDLAQRLERLHPELQERLSSSVFFLNHPGDDPLLGSKPLRDHVVGLAVQQTEKIPFEEIVESTPVRRVGACTLAVCCTAVALVLTNPSNAAIALRRLANPFGSVNWPQRTQLELVKFPRKVPKGDQFEITVAAAGVIPDRVVVNYRFEDETSGTEPLRTNADGHFVGGLEAVTRPFQFSVMGGDARTEWIPIDVVPAPEVTDLSVSLTYPGYTGLEPESYPEGRGHIRAVIGTQVVVQAHSNKPLQSAELQWEGTPAIPATGATIIEEGKGLTAAFTVTADAKYRVILHDTEGMSNSYRSPKPYRVEAIADRTPEIVIQHPAGDIEVTANADLPIKALVKDDFGSVDFSLRYEILSENPESLESISLGKLPQPAKLHTIEHPWALASLQLSQGQIVKFFLEATDSKTPEPNKGKSREIHVRIVNSQDFLQRLDNEQQLLREELERVLKLQQNSLSQVDELQKQMDIVGKLDDKDLQRLQSAEMIQRRVREKLTDSAQSLQNQVKNLLQELANNKVDDVDSSKRLLLMQSEFARVGEQHLPPISDSLTEAQKTASRLAEMKPGEASPAAGAPQSKDSPDSSATASPDGKPSEPTKEGTPKDAKEPGEAGAKKAEGEDANKSADAEKTADPANKDSQNSPEKTPGESGKPGKSGQAQEVAGNLSKAKEHQEQVVASLSQMLEQLNEWETIHQITSDARDLQRRQTEVSDQVKKVADDTLGKKTEDLSKEELAEIAKAGSRQDESREQFLRLQRKMNRLAESEKQTDPLTADLLDEAMKSLTEQNVDGKMTEASKQIKDNRLGEAGKQQQQVGKALQDLVSSLENRQEQELSRLVKKLQEAEKDLQDIREEQKRLLQKTREAEKIADPQQREEELKRLQRSQQQLQQRAEDFAKRLSRLRAEQASLRSGRAASRMSAAGQQMQKQNGQEQGEQAGDNQEQALEELQEAQEELAKARQEAEEKLAEEQLAKISDSLRQIHQREIGVKEELTRLENLRQSKGRLTRGELQSILSLARAQDGLSKEASLLTEKLSQAKVFVMVIEEAVEFMKEATGLLEERRTDDPTQQAVDSAADRFAQLLDSLKQDPAEKDKKKQQQQQQQQGGGGGGGQDGIPSIAQIKLLRSLQTELLNRTKQLAQVRGEDGKWSADQQKSFERLSERQGRLADLVRELSQPEPESNEEQL